MSNHILTSEYVRSMLNYDPITGVFTWKIHRSHNAKVGDAAGTATCEKYFVLKLDYKKYHAGRIAWLHFYGVLPDGEIDHIDRNPLNNSINNLRVVTRSENCQNRGIHKNNKLGVKGVSLHKKTGKYQAEIQINGKVTYLGIYKTIEEAKSAYEGASKLIHSCRSGI